MGGRLALGPAEVELATGRVAGRVEAQLGAVELRVLRALAAKRPPRPCRRECLEAALEGTGVPMEEAVAALVVSLGPLGHHVERVGRHAWRLWEGPE